jgi:hypothetical protein
VLLRICRIGHVLLRRINSSATSHIESAEAVLCTSVRRERRRVGIINVSNGSVPAQFQ